MSTPKLPPLIIKKSPSAFYVYTYKNKWNSEKARSERVEFKKVGTVVSGQKEGRIRWDEKFLEERPELRNFICERKAKGYVFEPLEKETGLSLKQVLGIKQLHAGATWALDQIVSSTPIGPALKKAFPQKRDYLKTLSIVYFIILNENNNISRYPNFAETTRLPWPGALHASTIGRIFRRIKSQQIENYFTEVQKGLLEQKIKANDTDKLTLALDSTSISSYSEKLPNVVRGRNKDEDNLPQINLLMLVDSKTGLPLFYRHYDGNVPDAQTVRRVIADNSRLKLTDVVLVSDKGYSSNKNINDCLRNDVGLLFNMKCGVKGSLTQEVIDEEMSNLRDLNKRDWYTEAFQITKKIEWSYERQPVPGKRPSKNTRDVATLYWHIYFDKQIAEKVTQGLFERIGKIQEKLHKKESLDENEQTLFEEVFEKAESTDEDTPVSYIINNKKVDEKLRYKGYRVLVSNEISDARKAWCAYQERWKVEDTFKTLKSRLGCSRNRVSDNESLNGKIFVQFLAASIAMVVRARLKKYSEECRKSDGPALIYDSDGTVLESLNNIMQTKFQAGYYFGEIAGKRRNLFEALGVSVPDSEPEREMDYEDEADEYDDDEL